MIESIVQSLLTVVGEGLEWVIQAFLCCISFDIEQFSRNFPVAGTMYTILQGVGFGLIFGICIFQLVKFFTGPLAESTETPLRICTRCLISAACILIGNYGLVAVCNLFSYPYADLLKTDGVKYQIGAVLGNLTEEGGAGLASSLTDLTVSASVPGAVGGVVGSVVTPVAQMGALTMLVLSLIAIILLGWNMLKLILEVVERYLVLMTIIYTSPLGWATISSESTAGIFKKWLSMFFSQCIMMLLNVWSFKVIISILGTGTSGDSNLFMRLILGLAFCKVAQRMDTYLNQIGANAAITGQNMLDDIVGLTAAHRAAHDVGGPMFEKGRKVLGALNDRFNSNNTPPVSPTSPVTDALSGSSKAALSSSQTDKKGASGSGTTSAGAGADVAAGVAGAATGAAAAEAASNAFRAEANGTESVGTSYADFDKSDTNAGATVGEDMNDASAIGGIHGAELGGGPATRLTPADQDIMRAALAESGGAAPTADQLNNARAQANQFNGDLKNAGLHMDQNGVIQSNGRSTGTSHVGEFARDKAGLTAVGDSAIARTISNTGTLGKQIAQDAIMNNANPIKSTAVGAAAAAAIIGSAKGGVGGLNAAASANGATAIGGLGANAIQDAAGGVGGPAVHGSGGVASNGAPGATVPGGSVSADGAPANGVGGSVEGSSGSVPVSSGGPTMAEDGTVVNGGGGSVTMDSEGNVVSVTGDADAGSYDGGTVDGGAIDGGSGEAGGAVDYGQFVSALNATASGTASAETGSVSDVISGNGEIVGTYNPPMTQTQAVDPASGAPLFNSDGSPKMESTPAVSNQPMNFSIMSSDAWSKLPANARAGYTSFTTEGGKEFRVKMTGAQVTGSKNTQSTEKVLGGIKSTDKNQKNNGKGKPRGKGPGKGRGRRK